MIKKFKLFGQISINNVLGDKLRLLRKYVEILKKSKVKDTLFAERFFIILYNYLIIEHGFFEELKENSKGINLYLSLDLERKTWSLRDINAVFLELYNSEYSRVRYNLEKFNENEIIKEYFEDKPYIFERLLDVDDTLNDIKYFKITSKYNI